MDKITVTLYDILGYLLPGYIVLVAISLAASTFAASSVLPLSAFTAKALALALAAYYCGALTHNVGSMLKNRWPKCFSSKKHRLDAVCLDSARKRAREVFGLPDTKTELNSLDLFILADSFVSVSGKCSDREILTAREGFCKGSMVAFAILTVVLCASIFASGIRIQMDQHTAVSLNWITSSVLALAAALVTCVFRRGFVFFNRIKVNNTILWFLALMSLPKSASKDADDATSEPAAGTEVMRQKGAE